MPLRRVHAAYLLTGLFLAGEPARAQDARAGSPPTQAERSATTGHVFKVVVWYERKRPFETFQHRAYDVSKGEYTWKVDDWVEMVGREYPGYDVNVQEVVIGGGDPATEVASVVGEEKLRLARIILQKYGVRRGGLATAGAGRSRSNRSPFRHEVFKPVAPLGSASVTRFPALGASGTSSPYPMRSAGGFLSPNPFPYPRPHP
jgi:hypothetical protein